MAQRRPSIVLLDGHSLAYRAFYALPDTLRTQSGQLTNAVYGFTSMLIKLLADRRPDAIAVAFDRGRDEQRVQAYPEYKANREAPPDEFRPQVELIQQVLEAMGIPVVIEAGVEADDVLATIAAHAVDEGYDAYVVTGDRDAMQLVDDHTTVLYTLKGLSELAEMTPAAVAERFGVPPERYVDFAALRGDTSDNLPGVPGVGDKTAAKLLGQYVDLDGIYEHIDQISGTKVPEQLREHEQQVRLNRDVMRLRRDVAISWTPADLQPREVDAQAVQELFGTLEFRALYDRLVDEILGEAIAGDAHAADVAPQRLAAGELSGWLDGVDGAVAVVAIVSGRVPHVAPAAFALAADDRAPVSASWQNLGDDDRDALANLLADSDTAKVTHDLKALDHVCAGLGWPLAGVEMDTELAAYLLTPQQRTFDLEHLALQHLQRAITDDADDDGDQLSLDVESEPWGQRAMRAQAVHDLAAGFEETLAQREQHGLLRTIEQPLVAVLARMERTGVAIDLEVLAELRDRLRGRIEELQREVHDLAGRRFNIGSGPQLQQVLFDELELPRTRRIKTGWSTDAQALGALRGEHAIIDAILDWRELTKLLSTYVDALPPLVDADTGRIHTTLSQTVAATGRLASSNPNLQNIPVRRQEGREIRRAFVAGDGFDDLLVADYSQIELRILAHLSADDGLLDAFASGEDIHATTAAKVFDLPLDAVDSALRDRAKAVNYGLAYGLTPYGLGQQLGIPPDEAREIVDAYFERFPKVRGYLDDTVQRAVRDGYTTTMFGRRRYLPDLRSDDRNRRQMAERMALNAPIQGTAADIIKLAMIELQQALDQHDVHTRQVLQVHDEVVLEVPDDEVDEVREVVVTTLSGVADLAVPLDVDTALGATWFDAQKH